MGNYIDADILSRRITSDRLSALCPGNNASVLVGEVIARAESMIDGYAAGRYAVPLPATDLVREWALCLAEYELYKRGPGNAVPEKIRESFQQTCSQLKDLAAGELQIPSAVPQSNGGRSFFTGPADPVFDAGSMRDY